MELPSGRLRVGWAVILNESAPSPLAQPSRLPWATSVVVAAAIVVYLWPAATQALMYDRLQIAGGQGWRVFTGLWVHFVPGPLLWNLAVLLPAGAWAEWLAPARTRWLYLIGPIVVGGVLYLTEPGLERYAGLSSMAAAMLVLLALVQLRQGEQDRWFWRSVLILLALKVLIEAVRSSAVISHVTDPDLQPVPLAHLAGIAAAAGVFSARRRRRP